MFYYHWVDLALEYNYTISTSYYIAAMGAMYYYSVWNMYLLDIMKYLCIFFMNMDRNISFLRFFYKTLFHNIFWIKVGLWGDITPTSFFVSICLYAEPLDYLYCTYLSINILGVERIGEAVWVVYLTILSTINSFG